MGCTREIDLFNELFTRLSNAVCGYRLPMSDRISFEPMSAALKHRFGDHVLPETHRATLHSLKMNPRESLHEFAAHVGELVSKSYPGLKGSHLHTHHRTIS